MDATANDVPGPYDVRGFPTLYWIPKDSKDAPVQYEVSILKYLVHFLLLYKYLWFFCIIFLRKKPQQFQHII